MDDQSDDDDESDLVPIKRQTKSLIASKSLPAVDSALDDFIIQANQKSLDVTEFTQESREQQLRDEIADLKKKLAAAEARATTATAEVEPPSVAPKRSWGAIVGAFVVGAGAMFAVSVATKSDEHKEAVPAAVNAPAVAPSPPAPDPIAHQEAPPSPPPSALPVPAETAPVPTPVPTPTKQPAVAVKQAPKQPKQPKQPTQPKDAPPAGEHADSGSAPPKPPPTQDGSGGDLYNPF